MGNLCLDLYGEQPLRVMLNDEGRGHRPIRTQGFSYDSLIGQALGDAAGLVCEYHSDGAIAKFYT